MNKSNEEWANSLTHGIATLCAIACLALLVVFASLRGTVWHVVSFAVYGSTLVILFSASTIYHSVKNPKLKANLRVLDHASIFLLIAGTYTPITLSAMRSTNSGWGWALFGTVWGIALIGVILKIFFTGRFGFVSTALYLLMGWLVVIAVKPFWHSVSHIVIMWIALGGLLYTVGVFFYSHKTMPYSHAIWHIFVWLASLAQFTGIMLMLWTSSPTA